MTRDCPECKSDDCYVAETRLTPFTPFVGNVVRRRRRCNKCYVCWWTLELPQEVVVALAREREEALSAERRSFTIGAINDEQGEA